MDAHLVRLKLTLLRNGLRRSVPQLVGMAVAALYALGVTAAGVAGLVALRFVDVDLARSLVVVLGSAMTLGWLIVPVLFTGVDQTLVACCVLVGVRQGARIYERRATDLLSDLARIR